MTTTQAAGSPLRIATRGSLLATTQAGTVRDALIAAGHPAELVIIKTPGDLSALPVQEIGVGVFTTAIREAVVAGLADIAVHSMKDLPTADDPLLTLAAIPPRADSRDVLVTKEGKLLIELQVGAIIGTSAPRRIAQLNALGLGLEIRPLRGNLDTRLNKVASGELDAVVVAHAGLQRIGKTEMVAEAFGPTVMLPAPAQGALAIECRSDNAELRNILVSLDDPATRASVTAERTLLAALEAGCTAPVGALAEVVESIDEEGRIFDELSLRAVVAAIDGSDTVRASITGPVERAAELGRELAAELFDQGAADLLAT